MSPGNAKDQHVIIGQISGLHGVRGGLRGFSYTHPRDRIFAYDTWLLKTNTAWIARKVVAGKGQGKGLVAFLEGISDRDQARELVGVEIAVTRDQLPQLAADEYYWNDLLHLEVIDTHGRSLGRVVEMQNTGANDVMVVQGGTKIMVPWVMDKVIKQVDIEAGRIYIDWDAGYQ